MKDKNEKTGPLISVIVPIYNVEKYVRKCLESLVHQTMKDIEIICIDDGSTDGSGKIADEYAGTHVGGVLIRVIHTENRGLSAARNRGIDEARADWIMFVDSDDWVSEDFCRVPYEAAIENKADLVVFEACQTTKSGWVRKTKTSQIQSGVIEKEDVMMNSTAWNKLYKGDLFVKIRYPEGRVYEDVFITHKLVDKAKKTYRLNDRLYYHRKRPGSISNSTMSWTDLYCAERQKYLDIVELGYPTAKAKVNLQNAALSYCGQAANTKNPLYDEAVETVAKIQGIPKEFNKKQIAKLLLWRTNRHLFRRLHKLLCRQMKCL